MRILEMLPTNQPCLNRIHLLELSSPISLILWNPSSCYLSRPLLSWPSATILAQVLITTPLEYCSGLFIALPVPSLSLPPIHSPRCHRAQGLISPHTTTFDMRSLRDFCFLCLLSEGQIHSLVVKVLQVPADSV